MRPFTAPAALVAAVTLLDCALLAGCGGPPVPSDARDDASDAGGGARDATPGTDASSGTDATDRDASGPRDGAAMNGDDASGADATTPGDTGAGDGGGVTGSAGCGRAPGIAVGSWVMQTVMVGGGARSYFVRLPAGYDPRRPYPVVYQFHGCSTAAARENNNPPIERVAGSEVVLVRGRANANCWDTAPMGVDVPYIDAMITAAETSVCVDPARRYAAGYSSGAFMTHQLGCIRASRFRGIASIAGGQAGRMCEAPVAALLIHDLNDGTVNISASVAARDSLVMRDGCSATAMRAPFMPAPCEAYTGCGARTPVVWCQTMGQDHSRQDTLASTAFWNFFSSLGR